MEHKGLLRFLTCGSVDDGKSTLIGRLLHDARQIYEDQLASLEADSKKLGTNGDELDLALLVDGLQAEREQGITIDVAYRYFSTSKRKFIIADTPGHAQYTRNMATGASTCDLAVILIDARQGVLEQTRRHSFIAAQLGIRHFVVAINKMDLVDFSQERFDQIQAEHLALMQQLQSQGLNYDNLSYIPISALQGDNVVERSAHTPWYQGESLLSTLEQVEVTEQRSQQPVRLPVQMVSRPSHEFRGFAGTLVSGQVRPGDTLMALPSGQTSQVERIVSFDGDLDHAEPDQAVTLTLTDEIDISRGDMLVAAAKPPLQSQYLRAKLIWMDEEPLTPGQEFRVKLASKKTQGRIDQICHRLDIRDLSTHKASTLGLNDVAEVVLELNEQVAFDPYAQIRDTGSLILIDRDTNRTVAAAMLIGPAGKCKKATTSEFSAFELELNALVRKHFPHWEAVDLSKL